METGSFFSAVSTLQSKFRDLSSCFSSKVLILFASLTHPSSDAAPYSLIPTMSAFLIQLSVFPLFHHLFHRSGYIRPCPGYSPVSGKSFWKSALGIGTINIDPKHRNILLLCHFNFFCDSCGAYHALSYQHNRHVASANLVLDTLLPLTLRQCFF